MMTTRIPESPHYEFRWEQDSRSRVLMLTGVIDSSAVSHLESAIINLGSRRLVVNLSQVTSIDPSAASILLQMAGRLGAGRISVVVDPHDEVGITLTDVADVSAFPDSA